MDPKSRQILSLAAFQAYLGFLNVLVAHNHLVMIVFCHLLIKRNFDRGLEESVRPIESSGSSREQSYRKGLLYFCLTDSPLIVQLTASLTARPNE